MRAEMGASKERATRRRREEAGEGACEGGHRAEVGASSFLVI